MNIFVCHVCRTTLSAEDSQSGQLVRCPSCLTTMRVPSAVAAPSVAALAPPPGGGAGAGGTAQGGPGASYPVVPPPLPSFVPPPPMIGGGQFSQFSQMPQAFGGNMRSAGRRYGFNCGYCSSRLEANEAMAAQDGQCPTCGNNITIPILDRYGRLIDPKTRRIIKQDPHPVHAYAAAGERAPAIFRDPAGKQLIRCPRAACGYVSPITANNCKNCGMPFTMEGTTVEAAGSTNGFCVASMVLGIISIVTALPGVFGAPGGCVAVPALVATLSLIFGIVGTVQVNKSAGQRRGRGMGIAGIVMAAIALCVFVYALTKN